MMIMKGVPATYLGRIVEKKNFRAFIYAPSGDQRLVESWEEFEANMQSGLWFATKEDAAASIAKVEEEKTKPAPRVRKPAPKAKPEVVEDEVEDDLIEDEAIPEDAAFEVKPGDDFLPKTASK
jgi:hypothetical protein